MMIRQGKGAKDRNAPIGERALSWLGKNMAEIRPILVERTNTSVLFVSRNGRPFGAANLSSLVRDYVKAAGITRPGSCHLFRHAAATQMLENGADIRSLQTFLGHAQITTTQIYAGMVDRRARASLEAVEFGSAVPSANQRPLRPESDLRTRPKSS